MIKTQMIQRVEDWRERRKRGERARRSYGMARQMVVQIKAQPPPTMRMSRTMA